ncbi:MAG: hypothetical protein K0S44_3379 [Bacteroidetes bacterium]|nr:hypothetical protein [Bacteroidota bacterium]
MTSVKNLNKMLTVNIKIRYLFILFLSTFLFNLKLLSTNAVEPAYDSLGTEVRTLPGKEKDELFSSKDYVYDKTGPAPRSLWDKFTNWLSEHLDDLFETKGMNIGLRILEYALIIAAIVIIVLLLLKNNIRSLFYGKSAEADLEFSDLKENIHLINFDALISEAIANKDFRRATRLQFLRTLKDLSDRELIKWKIDKTNHDYSMELSNSKHSSRFNELALLYDHVWYGDLKIDEEKYNQLEKKFKESNFGE